MTETSMIVETSSLAVRPGGPATANIWMVINGREFPMRRWNDFVVVVLSWWATALLQLLRNTSAKETLHFMDGPYTVEVSKTASGMLQFRALEGSGRNIETAIGEEPTLPFILGLIAQSREVLNECKLQNWWSKDAETLKISLEALEREFPRLMKN
jgi:hypothetical protein